MMFRPTPRALLFMITAVAAVGCGSKFVVAEGTVTLDGQPVEGATINFIPDGSGLPASGPVGKGGHFRVLTDRETGIAPGKYKVTFSKVKAEMKGEGITVEELLPAVYGDPARTPLRAEVPKEGKRDFAFSLTSSEK